MKKTQDFVRYNKIDLSDEIVTLNPISTPLTTLLFSRNQVKQATDHYIRQKVKTLSSNPSGGRKEGHDAPEVEKSEFGYVENYIETFSKTAAVSGFSAAIAGGGNKSLAQEINDRLQEVKADIEGAFFTGVKKVEDADSGFKTAGLLNQVEEVVDLENGALTEDIILDAIQAIYEGGAADGDLYIFANPSVKRKVNRVFTDEEKVNVNFGAGEQGAGIVIDRIYTDFGIVNLAMANKMPAGQILAVNLDFVDIYQLRAPQYEELAKTGDSDKGMVLTDSGILLANPNAGSKIINIG